MGDDGEEVHFHGPTSAYAHISHKPTQRKSPAFVIDSDQPHTYRRYLPQSVQLSDDQHRIALDRFFRFFSSWGMRATPSLFQRDLMQAVASPTAILPRTSHYSPLLHNIILAIALIFADEDFLRAPETRAIFAQEAQNHLEAELRRPTLATVIGLALKSSYHSTMGDHTTGWTYYGLADRAAQSCEYRLLFSADDKWDSMSTVRHCLNTTACRKQKCNCETMPSGQFSFRINAGRCI